MHCTVLCPPAGIRKERLLFHFFHVFPVLFCGIGGIVGVDDFLCLSGSVQQQPLGQQGQHLGGNNVRHIRIGDPVILGMKRAGASAEGEI